MNQALDDCLTLTINGSIVRLTGICPTLTLLEYLRQAGHTGTKEGCGDGDCGACTVVIIAPGSDGQSHYQAVNSCLIPIAALAGREILTVEGIASAQLHPVQAAMVQTGGSQCGYCTPGFIMSLFAAYYDGTMADSAVEGNLCRCTGYLAIRRAVQQMITSIAAHPPIDQFSQQLAEAKSDLPALNYTNHQASFYRPTQLQTVLDLLQQHPTAVLVAGATDLGLELSHHRQQFPVMISLEAVAELKQITVTDTTVTIGAAVTLTTIADQLRGIFPSLDEMLYWFAARQIRNRATIGGNIGNASPIGDLPPVLLALDAELLIAGHQGRRTIAIADFFQGYRQTALQVGEVIVSVRIPRTLTPKAVCRLSQSYKVGKRGTDDISIVAAAFTVDLDAQKHIIHARLAYGGVAATPMRAIAVEQSLLGQPWNLTIVQGVKAALRETFTPLTDMRGSAAYRRLLVANLFEKFFVEGDSDNSEVGV
ncbi:xanthine dehydrogenase small subunit [Pantanalinema sp. GBBB05]|uniref:xanthine dehydrogenase small subunit n=1 Tax=Pantanalinema sp. GBBB05 TaxID=2604139 RepID=UPI001DEDB9B5|nr:xanthine dehydrogenase small subunit [Pantanalinema sp. GBBB05]